MSALITSKRVYTEGPELPFHCPRCGKLNEWAQTCETAEEVSILILIPLSTTRFTKLRCTRCRKSFTLVKSLDEVQALCPEDIAQCLAMQVPFFVKFCIVTSFVLMPFPFVGLVFGGIGLVATVNKLSRWKWAALTAMVLSAGPIVLLIMAHARGL